MHSTKGWLLVRVIYLGWYKLSKSLSAAERVCMRFFVLLSAVTLYFIFPSSGAAQNTGQIECARSDEYVYLYGSMTTLQVRGTLQCGEIVSITLRYDYYYGVRTAKGDTGFVSQSSVVLIKDKPGGDLPTPPTGPAPRERTHYDQHPHSPPPRRVVPPFTLLKDTPVRIKLTKTISSRTAHVGDTVEFEVLDEVLVEGVPVLNKGAKVNGVIDQAEPKKRFGHNGTLAVSITSLRLTDGERAPLRAYEQASVDSAALSTKDATLSQNTEFTILIDGDVHLKREGFEPQKDNSAASPTSATEPPQPKL